MGNDQQGYSSAERRLLAEQMQIRKNSSGGMVKNIKIMLKNEDRMSQHQTGIKYTGDRRPQTADRRPQTADRRPQT
ncbi:MAG TPA: hypothetical protein PLB10_17915, partial [Thiolinea sp.]|nr:hypothetical protein [Thiolinea sp.]